MKLHNSKLLFAFLLSAGAVSAQVKPEPAVVERYSPKLDAIISNDATMETIMDGFDWCEGPLWVEKAQMFVVSDVPQNTVYKWTAAKGKEVFLKPSGYTGTIPRGGEMGSNGLALTNDGRLLLCQDGDRKIAIMDAAFTSPKPSFITVADNYSGKKFNSPNDMAVAKNGDIFFTDPPYGLEKNMADPLKEMPYQGVFKISKDKKVTLLLDSITRPNGIGLFPGNKQLLIANSDKNKPHWYIFDVEKDGLKNGRIFFNAMPFLQTGKGMPDGLKIDSKGNVFASGPGGIWIFSKTAELLGKIKVSPVASNCSLSGDEKTLFITADDHVVKVKLR